MRIEDLKFDAAGLIPAIVTDFETGEVLMQAYMNREAIERTKKDKKVTFWSRSRQEIWQKGETSGNYLKLCGICADCDGDSLLVSADPKGPACHTGEKTCFFNELEGFEMKKPLSLVLREVYDTVEGRKKNPKEGSYTNYLFEKGIDKILKKVGEEAAEVIIAAKNNSKEEIRYEMADLFYHLIVLLSERGMTLADIYEELKGRR